MEFVMSFSWEALKIAKEKAERIQEVRDAAGRLERMVNEDKIEGIEKGELIIKRLEALERDLVLDFNIYIGDRVRLPKWSDFV